MEELIELMKRIEAMESVKTLASSGEPVYLTDSDLLPEDVVFFAAIERWEQIAERLLITEDGHPNWEHLGQLEDLGYKVGPGEKDSLGWVTGKVWSFPFIYIFG